MTTVGSRTIKHINSLEVSIIKVYVLSRNLATKYCRQTNDNPVAIISISTPGVEYEESPFISKKNKVAEILSLTFRDADCPETKDVYGYIAHLEDLMSDNDAQKVAEFAERHKDKPIIVHCDAGISRSSAIGAALLRVYNGSDDEIFNSRWFAPNMWCYYKTLKAFGYDYTPDGVVEVQI